MAFSVATALSRLDSGPKSAFTAGLTSDQKLQRVNEVLEYFFEMGTWRGLHDTISLTSSSGIISLPTGYQRLDALGDAANIRIIPIKSQQWAFSQGGPGFQDWTLYSGNLIAIDLGDNSSSVRRYQLTGTAANNDTLSLTGLARKRFIWITNTANLVYPDSYQALFAGVRAFGWRDEGDNDRFKSEIGDALAILNGNLGEFEPLEKTVTMRPELSGRSIRSLV